MHVSFHNNYGCNGSTQSVALTSVIEVNESSNLKVSSFTKKIVKPMIHQSLKVLGIRSLSNLLLSVNPAENGYLFRIREG